jgi:predicted DNA-binding transcriptional regulator AlpA
MTWIAVLHVFHRCFVDLFGHQYLVLTVGIVFLKLSEVSRRVNLKHAAIYERIRLRLFPLPVKIPLREGSKRSSSLWVEDEITAWQNQQIAVRDLRLIPLNQVRLYVVGATLLRGLSRLMMSQ